MKTYQIEMRRTYSTYFEVKATNLDEAVKEFEKLGFFIYEEELNQTCIIDEKLRITDEQGNTYGVEQEPEIYQLVKI